MTVSNDAQTDLAGVLDPLVADRLGPLWSLEPLTETGIGPHAAQVLEVFGAPYGPKESAPVLIEEILVRGPHGAIPLRVYRPPSSAGPLPGLVWMHGGAFMFGDLDMPEADEFARGVVARAGAVVISVDYRLAVGGVHFPVPHDDVVAAFRWVVANAAELGVDPARVAVGGGSAGANLAAGAALRLRDEGEAQPWQVLLAYPVVHAVVPDAPGRLEEAMRLIPPVLRFPADLTVKLNENYLGGPLTDVSPYAFAGEAEDLAGYPPTFIENAEFDDLRPSGERFAEQLSAAGVEVELTCQPGVPHGHLNQVALPAQQRSLDRFAGRLAQR